MSLATVRKFAAAIAGALAQAVAAGVLPEQYAKWAAVAIAIATALGVYAVPNADPAAE